MQALQHGAKQAASKLGFQAVGGSQLSNVSAAAALQAAANSALFRSSLSPYGTSTFRSLYRVGELTRRNERARGCGCG